MLLSFIDSSTHDDEYKMEVFIRPMIRMFHFAWYSWSSYASLVLETFVFIFHLSDYVMAYIFDFQNFQKPAVQHSWWCLPTIAVTISHF